MREIHERFGWYMRMGTIRKGERMRGHRRPEVYQRSPANKPCE